MSQIRWLPLESNPEVMNKYVQGLGMNSSWGFHDVFGLDPELLMMVPRPVAAVLLLYPLSDLVEAQPIGKQEENHDIYFMRQFIGNACGTIGLIHALCNNSKKINLGDQTHIGKFLMKTKDLSPDERGRYLEGDTDFGQAHEQSASEGQTAAPDRNEKVDLHFVAFVHHEGGLYELDGRKPSPTRHGDTTEASLLEDSVKVIQKFMERDPTNINFTIVALASN